MPTSEIQMLGVPLGSDASVSNYVQGKLLASSVKVMSKLAEFEDTQAAMYLLRLSYGIVRANHSCAPLLCHNGLKSQINLICVCEIQCLRS